MIRNPAKRKLLAELEKSGNVYVACLKLNISRATFYRWREENKEFRMKSDKAIRHGRENNCDFAEHALMRNIKDGKLDAIKYQLSHNSSRYRSNKPTKVILEHTSRNSARDYRLEDAAETDRQIDNLRGLLEDVKNSVSQ